MGEPGLFGYLDDPRKRLAWDNVLLLLSHIFLVNKHYGGDSVRRILGTCVGLLGGILLSVVSTAGASGQAKVSGELRQWHKVTLTVEGPTAAEEGEPNPFLDYRMLVSFRHDATGLTYDVPGYFAADGDAANTSATSGNKWRAHLSPDHEGKWTYTVSFRQGKDIAVSEEQNAGEPVAPVDGLTGDFVVDETDKTGRDMRARGRLKYVGKHHLQFVGTGEFFLKAGADAPENFLAFREFDGDFKTDGHKDKLIKDWQPHVQDWRPGDPTWQDDEGKGIIGAINYLASQGLNAFSFIPMNIEGDDRNVFPYTSYDVRDRIDCSRMDQWEIVFSHGTKMGMYLHFKTQEAENVNLLDGGHLGLQRKLYYRELIARFGHHLAINWNLGEEVGLGHKVSTKKKKDWAEYFRTHDPYQHHMVIHNGDRHYDLLGKESALTGFSLQTNQPDFRNVHNMTRDYIRRSVKAGKPWVVACDEPGDASHALITDAENPSHDNARMNALWGNIMAGGAGVEWYFGYKHPESDLTCQDYRVRENMWEQCRIALNFFEDHEIPFWEMTNANWLVGSNDAFCLQKPGKLYLVYLKQGESTTLNLSKVSGFWDVLWFNPREGGPLAKGSSQAVQGGGKVALGEPPNDPGRDWLAIVRPGDPSRDYPVVTNASSDSYDPTKAKKVHKQVNGIVVVEAEEYDAIDHEEHRFWRLTTLDHTPDDKPDPDPSHAEGASGGAYLEILPDTRRTHADPLVGGVSFCNVPGQCSILYYPVIFEEPGRYYVWVRMCCTGSEDNGLHVGIDGHWPKSGARLQFTGRHGQWQWDSRQRTAKVHTGVLGQIWLDVDEPGLHTITFSMREDGFEFDKFLLTRDPKPMKSKSGEMGPPNSPKASP